jgi:RHS repeat-associated protein
VYEPDSFAPLAQLEHQQNKLPLPLGEGWGEGSASDKESNRSAANSAQTALDDEALDNPRQAAARFQAMMQAKASQIKGAVALAHAQHAAANDPDRTRRMQSVPGSAIKRALETGGNATPGAAANESANEATQGSTNKERPSKRYRVNYFHNDHLGTPRELSSEQGEIQWAATYKAWGNTLKVEWVAEHTQQTQQIPAAQNEAKREQNRKEIAEVSSQDIAQPLRFQGQYYDNETGLHYNRFRYYDPDCGRFVSQDPIGFLSGTVNLYHYAPNALNWIDPSGLANHFPRQTGGRFGANPSPQPKPKKCGHGNSTDSTSAQHGYVIIDTWNNKYKIGVSGQPLNLDGSSPRANQQVNAWNAEPGNTGRYKAIVQKKIPSGCDARTDILKWEAVNAARLRAKGLIDVLRHVKP